MPGRDGSSESVRVVARGVTGFRRDGTPNWNVVVGTAGDRLQVQAYTQGGHVDGRVTLHYCDAV